MNVPFLDLKAQYRQIKDEVHEALDKVMAKGSRVIPQRVKKRSGAPRKIMGPYVNSFDFMNRPALLDRAEKP